MIPGIARLIDAALDEDVGHGDLTAEACVAPDAIRSAYFLAKQDLVVCGLPVAIATLQAAAGRYGGAIAAEITHDDGDRVAAGTVIARVHGSALGLIVGERTALNFLMKLSGIATHVGAYVEAAGADGPTVVDTRKTTPTLRHLEKYAVRVGGAQNHRHALFDGVMVKDNHISAVGSLTEAVRLARANAHHLVRVEVEARTLAEVDEALTTAADVLLLDNMSDDELAEAVRRCRAAKPSVLLEASGNITPERIARIRHLGLDLVSAGGLIHQARWADLSMKLA